MRLFEVYSATLKSVASPLFIQNFQFFARGYPVVEKRTKEFVDFKVKNPREKFGSKDLRFATGTPLSPYQHVHIVHGKVIIIYNIVGDELRLLDMVEHRSLDGRTAGKTAERISDIDTQPIDLGDGETIKTLPKERIDELNELFYMLAVEEKGVLQAVIDNDHADEFIEYVRHVVPEDEASLEEIVQSFGGRDDMINHLSNIIKQVGG